MKDREGLIGAPKGTRDLVPPESWSWQGVTRLAMDLFSQAGYAPVETPAFEHTEVFERGVGAASEVVNKQMFTFTDLGGRSLTLRPEGTAPVVRAVLEGNLHRGALPLKLAYSGPMFRQERPQKGRYRQFFQVGIEVLGSEGPAVDVEVIEIGARFLRAAGVEATLGLNSIGHLDDSCRLGYLEVLKRFLHDRAGSLAPADRDRVRVNPLRTFDSKEPATIDAMSGAPLISEHLCDACRKHFGEVQDLLGDLDVGFELAPRLVRGLDYYTRTAFEFVAPGLGAQDAVGGGGRYDGLAEALGGDALPGIGFALGVDRILLARTGPDLAASGVGVYVVALGEEAARVALRVATQLRVAGIGADLDLGGRGMKGQMKDADRSGARWAVILGDEELANGTATIRDMESGEQSTVAMDELTAAVRS